MKKEDIIICRCHSPQHQYLFFYDDEDERDKIVYIETHLNKKPFFKRLKYGIKYIFGYQCNYGSFDEFIIKPEDVDKFENVVKYLKK